MLTYIHFCYFSNYVHNPMFTMYIYIDLHFAHIMFPSMLIQFNSIQFNAYVYCRHKSPYIIYSYSI